MAKIKQDYIKELEKYLNLEEYLNSEADLENKEAIIIPKGLKGNVSANDWSRDRCQLLYLVIDKSYSIYNNGLEEAIRQEIADVKKAIKGSYEESYIQIAMTFFGSTLDMRPFQYGECIDTSYEANETKTRLYDAVVESCKNLIYQYDALNFTTTIKAAMLIFTDGEDNGSELYHDAKDVQVYLDEITKRGIRYIVAAFKGVNTKHIANDFKTEPIIIDSDSKLRTLLLFVSRKPNM